MKSNQLLNETSKNLKNLKLTKEEKKELKARGVSLRDRKAINEYRDEKAKEAEEKKKQEEEEAKAKAEAERLANPTQEDLLKEIITLLKEKNN